MLVGQSISAVLPYIYTKKIVELAHVLELKLLSKISLDSCNPLLRLSYQQNVVYIHDQDKQTI